MEPFFTYKNIVAAQTPTTIPFLLKLFNENTFKTIIEIGTNRGGLSLWISDHKPKDSHFVTLDLWPDYLKFNPLEENVDFRAGDCFTTLHDTIKQLLQKAGQTLLLCDGGNKNLEFLTFAPFLKKDDVILCHDFVDDMETYKKIQQSIGWPTEPESHMSAIKNCVQENNLQPYYFEEAKQCLWGCFKKQ